MYRNNGNYNNNFKRGAQVAYPASNNGFYQTRPSNQPEFKITSGAKRANAKEGFGVSAWKKQGANFITFYFNTDSKKAKKVTGKNGKEYIASVPVKVFNKTTLQESFTWGLWNPSSNTLTMDKIGLYISLKNGGFVGRIKG